MENLYETAKIRIWFVSIGACHISPAIIFRLSNSWTQRYEQNLIWTAQCSRAVENRIDSNDAWIQTIFLSNHFRLNELRGASRKLSNKEVSFKMRVQFVCKRHISIAIGMDALGSILHLLISNPFASIISWKAQVLDGMTVCFQRELLKKKMRIDAMKWNHFPQNFLRTWNVYWFARLPQIRLLVFIDSYVSMKTFVVTCKLASSSLLNSVQRTEICEKFSSLPDDIKSTCVDKGNLLAEACFSHAVRWNRREHAPIRDRR